ncbi:MAG: hemolysin family protein [Acidimicrobiia bacterium]
MSLLAVLITLLLVLVNGFFVSVEFAYTASRRHVLEDLAEKGSRFARWALASMSDLPVTFAGAQLGIAAASLALGFVIENSLESSFEGVYLTLGLPEGTVAAAAVTTALVVISFIHNVFGEMAPKNATIAAPERAALLLAAPFRGYLVLFRPAILSLSWVAGAILRLFRVEPRNSVEMSPSADDIATLVSTIGAGGIIDPSSSRLLNSALRFRKTLVSEVMVPRPDLVALPITATPAEFEQTVVRTGHSRIPVYDGNLDDIQGFVHAKDLLAAPAGKRHQPLDRKLVRPVPVVPETMPVSPVLEMMRSEGVHLAIAIDEHGSVSGLVTLEDIAEELVGEIRDEHDIREVMEIRPAGKDRYLIAGQTRTDRLRSLGVNLPEGEYETVGGFVMAKLGRVPRRGDTVITDSFEITVRRLDGRRVREVELRLIGDSGEAPPTGRSG